MSEAGLPEADCPVRPGDVIAGKYLVERILGAGGMGVVVAATQTDLERKVALKFLLPRVLERRDHVARFAREARAAAKLESEHVARVLDVGALENGAAYIVMEYLEGQDLGRLLAARGRLPVADAVGYVLEASEAVAEAHALGIVHRDLKPGNLFLARRTNGRPVIKVLDFGLSKFSASDDQVTSESSILGSPLYMSPEQLLSARNADPRSDIWSLGVTLYELLSAQPAFAAERMPELIAAIIHGHERPLESLDVDIPAGLRAAVHRCLEKDRSKRFADIAQFAAALAPFASPSHQACVARIAHLLGPAHVAAAPPDETHEEASLVAEQPTVAAHVAGKAVTESLAGASQSLTTPSPARSERPGDGGRTTGRLTKGRALGYGAAAVIAGAVAIVAITRRTPGGGENPVAADVGTAPGPSAVAPVDTELRPPREEPAPAFAAASAPTASASAPAASESARRSIPRAAPLQSAHEAVPRPSPSPASSAAAPPSASAAPSSTPARSADALTKLKQL